MHVPAKVSLKKVPPPKLVVPDKELEGTRTKEEVGGVSLPLLS